MIDAILQMQELVKSYKLEWAMSKKREILREVAISGACSSIFSQFSNMSAYYDFQMKLNLEWDSG